MVNEGMWIVTLYELHKGKPILDEYVTEDIGEDTYILGDYYIEVTAPFDEKAQELLDNWGI